MGRRRRRLRNVCPVRPGFARGLVSTIPGFETLYDAAAALEGGDVSPTELLRETLERVEAEAASFNCYLSVMADDAKARALELERIAVQGRGPLWGIPVSVKDCFATT